MIEVSVTELPVSSFSFLQEKNERHNINTVIIALFLIGHKFREMF
jgi:hypothetical protein